MGILTNPNADAVVNISASEFDLNGAPGASAEGHNIYIGIIKEVIADNIYSHDNITGHQFKSRAKKTTLTNSRLYDGTNGMNYNVDVPEGGVTLIQGNTMQQTANDGNHTMIAYGLEVAPGAGSSLTVNNNTMVNDNTGTGLMLRNVGPVAQITNNKVWGLTVSQIASGPSQVSGTVFLTVRPPLA